MSKRMEYHSHRSFSRGVVVRGDVDGQFISSALLTRVYQDDGHTFIETIDGRSYHLTRKGERLLEHTYYEIIYSFNAVRARLKQNDQDKRS